MECINNIYDEHKMYIIFIGISSITVIGLLLHKYNYLNFESFTEQTQIEILIESLNNKLKKNNSFNEYIYRISDIPLTFDIKNKLMKLINKYFKNNNYIHNFKILEIYNLVVYLNDITNTNKINMEFVIVSPEIDTAYKLKVILFINNKKIYINKLTYIESIDKDDLKSMTPYSKTNIKTIKKFDSSVKLDNKLDPMKAIEYKKDYIDIDLSNTKLLLSDKQNLKTLKDRLQKLKEEGYRCIGSVGNTEDECNSKNTLDGKEKKPGIWDRPCVEDNECPFYNEKKNNGGCNNGYCKMPDNVESISFRKFNKQSKPVCIGCKEKKDIFCCDEQKNIKLYPELEGFPNYSFGAPL
tara:strand:+ start:797 stop:1855 length:1059 start_codon:yes stop_codon:yes gene_type:complete